MRTILVLAAGLALLTGCTTTPASRRQAADLANRVAAYQKEQRQRVDDLNDRYRRSQARLMEALARDGEDELYQTFRTDAQRNADQLLADWEKVTLPSQFRDLFERNVASQRARIDEIEQRLASARAAYAEAYTEARLDVARLDTARSGLIAVSQADRSRDLSRLVALVAKIHQCLKAERDAATASGPGAAAAPPSAAGGCQ